MFDVSVSHGFPYSSQSNGLKCLKFIDIGVISWSSSAFIVYLKHEEWLWWVIIEKISYENTKNVDRDIFNPFVPNVPFLDPLKILENC